MKRRKRRRLSGLVCLAFCCGFLPMGAGAEENGEEMKVTVTQEAVTDEATGNITTTTTTITQGPGYQQTEENTLVTDEDGNVIRESGWQEGSESKTEEKSPEDLTLDFGKPEAGKSASDTGEAAQPAVSGDVKTGEDDPEYDQTTVTETPREAEGTLTEVEVTLGDGDVEYSDQIHMGVGSLTPVWPEREDLNVHNVHFDPDGENPEGYDYYYSAYTGDSVYGVKILDEDGNVLQYCDVVQFELTNGETGEKHTAYCADVNTGTKNGWWYTMENVEDANYVSEEDAAHIRAVAANGYWGTAEGTGSLDQMKQTLKAALAADAQALGGLTEADIEGFTAGEAQAATQMAIWRYGNHFRDKAVTFTASSCDGSWSASHVETPTEEELAAWNRINQVAAYLAALEPEDSESQILSQDKFLRDVGIVVGEKAADHANNADEDDTNDAYHVDLTFALEVRVAENDDLIVKVLDGSGTVLRTVRLAGDDSRTGYGVIVPDESGKYTIGGLTLIEGEAAFRITLEGAQYLEEGVYLYTSETQGEKSSQTFVGMAQGYQAVDLGMEVTFCFQVDEGSVTTQRVWRQEWSREEETTEPEEETTEPEQTTEPEEEPTQPATETTAGKDDGQNPQTGDENNAVQWMLMMVFCGAALVATLCALKRRA